MRGMRRTGGFIGLAVLLVLGAGAAFWRAELQRLWAVNGLFDAERIVGNFSRMDQLFFHAPLPLRPAPQALPLALAPLPGLEGFLAERRVTGLVVLHHGVLVDERYLLGTSMDDRRISWSVAKSFLSALVGIVVAEGQIESLDAPVTRYAPSLAGTAYDGASLRHVLQMSSGVRFDEDYFAFFSDINRMGRVLALGQSMDDFARSLDARERAPGSAWQYVSIDTHVIGMVIRGATGRGVAELMAEKLLQPLGLESSAYYLTDGYGEPFVLGGLNMSTRDYARFGQLMLQRGRWGAEQVVPAAWVDESTRASAPTAGTGTDYGYQWWVPRDAVPGEFLARGVYGQYIYVHRPSGTVVAMNSADRAFADPGVFEAVLASFRRIAATLAARSASPAAAQPSPSAAS
jgi:CubicO group peptidase (beta-lactamase class C family)